MVKIFIMVFAVEALTFLIFFAAPVQGIRKWIIKRTSFLESKDMGHLLNCKVCTSVWISALMTPLYFYMDMPLVMYFLLALVIFRLANYFHQVVSLLRDLQFDIRVNRGRGE
jgi:hypothetical protein